MKKLRDDLQSVVKSLKSLTRKTEKMVKRLSRLEKAVAKRPKAKAKVRGPRKTAAKKATTVTASNTVMDIIKRSRKGVQAAALKKKTGFDNKKIRDIVYRLKKQGKIKTERKGFYVKP
jgi:DNA replicative helicase MCM subunit Mcm2 (Cdc46/Mcm family)